MNATNTYSVQYDIWIYEKGAENKPLEIQKTINGYRSVDALRADIGAQMTVILKHYNIRKADIVLEIVITDPDGVYCDSDTLDLRCSRGEVIFEP